MKRRVLDLERGVATLLLLFVVALYSLITYIVAGLEDMFQEGRIPVPRITQFVLDTYLYWLIFPLAAVGGFVLVILRKSRRGWILLACSGASALVLLPVMVWTMYAPVMQ
jgi:hypothetical protein